MSGAAISSMTARLTVLPQKSVNQRPTTALLCHSQRRIASGYAWGRRPLGWRELRTPGWAQPANRTVGCGEVHSACKPWGATMDVGDFLRKMSVQRYEVAFHDNGVGDRVLPKQTNLNGMSVATAGIKDDHGSSTRGG